MARRGPIRSEISDQPPSWIEKSGLFLALAWLVVIGLLFWAAWPSAAPVDGFIAALATIALLMPFGLIWVAVSAARSARLVQREARRVDTAIEAMRNVYMADRMAAAETTAQDTAQQVPAEQPQPERSAPAQTAVRPDSQPAAQTTVQSGAQSAENRPRARRRMLSQLIVPQPAPKMPDEQPSLALGIADNNATSKLARSDLIRALHFPDDENDTEGFDALRRALRERDPRRLIQASQDVLTLLSQDGIYMEDMQTNPVDPSLWRRFANGERGAALAKLGAVRSAVALDLAVTRMRDDAIFRDAAHHFLRRFDQMLTRFETDANDEEMAAMTDTRTARAFVLLGRATGTFR